MPGESNLDIRLDRLEIDRDSLYELIDRVRKDVRIDLKAFCAGSSGRFDGLEETLVEGARRLPEPS